MSDKKTSKIEFNEKIIDSQSKFKHIKNGELLTFVNFSLKPYQKKPIGVFKKVSDDSEIEYNMDEVEKLIG